LNTDLACSPSSSDDGLARKEPEAAGVVRIERDDVAAPDDQVEAARDVLAATSSKAVVRPTVRRVSASSSGRLDLHAVTVDDEIDTAHIGRGPVHIEAPLEAAGLDDPLGDGAERDVVDAAGRRLERHGVGLDVEEPHARSRQSCTVRPTP